MKHLSRIVAFIAFFITLVFQSHAEIIDSPEHKRAEKLFESNQKLRQLTLKVFDLETTARCHVALATAIGFEMSGKLPLESNEKFGYAMLYEAVAIGYLHHISAGQEKKLKSSIEMYEKRSNKVADTQYCFNSLRAVLNSLN
jgi:hypothetical protein